MITSDFAAVEARVLGNLPNVDMVVVDRASGGKHLRFLLTATPEGWLLRRTCFAVTEDAKAARETVRGTDLAEGLTLWHDWFVAWARGVAVEHAAADTLLARQAEVLAGCPRRGFRPGWERRQLHEHRAMAARWRQRAADELGKVVASALAGGWPGDPAKLTLDLNPEETSS